MILVQPEHVIFNSRQDIVDYVSKGLPPTKNNFIRLQQALYSPIDFNGKEHPPCEYGKDVIINKKVIDNIDIDEFNSILTRVYQNNVRNRNILIGLGITAATIMFIMNIFDNGSNSKSK